MLRVDGVPGVATWIEDASAPGGRRLNPDAFTIPTDSRQGTSPRNSLRAAPLHQVDLGLVRQIRFGRATAQLRVEAFNIFNRASFGAPATNRPLPGFGLPFQSQADAMGTGTLAKGGLAPLHQLGGPRSIHIALRLGL